MNGLKNKTGLSNIQLALLILILVLIFIAFWGGLENVFIRWMRSEEYSHGFFIPLISLMLLWSRREALLESLGPPSWFGVILLLISSLVLLVGELSAIFILIQLGFILAIAGTFLAFGGWSLIKVSLLPIAFLLFAIPMPYFIDAQLTWGLQLISSELGTQILRWLGVSVYQEGNVIDLGIYKLQVVEACSGLNYLYPLLSLGFLAAYLFSGPIWQRIVVFLSTIPITVFMNSFRIAMIGVLVDNWGIEMAEGFLHFFEGWIIFIGCAALLLFEIWIFERFGKRRLLSEILTVPQIAPVKPKEYPRKKTQALRYKTLSTSAVIFLGMSLFVLMIDERDEIIVPKKDVSAFPLVIDQWSALEDHLPSIVENQLQVDEYFLGDYKNTSNDWLNFYIAYYASQRKGVSPHSPRVCIPGGGWLIADLSTVTVSVPGYPDFPVNRIIIDRDGQKQLGYYWFEQRGRRIANEYLMKWYLLKDALFMNRTDGALVRIMTSLQPDDDLQAVEQRIQGFVESMIPILPEYVPGE